MKKKNHVRRVEGVMRYHSKRVGEVAPKTVLLCSRQEEEQMQRHCARTSLETCLRSMKEARELEAGD